MVFRPRADTSPLVITRSFVLLRFSRRQPFSNFFFAAFAALFNEFPAFPKLKENNVRKGFLEDSQYRKLVEGSELWFRTLVELGRTYGWRVSELIGLSVKQVDLAQRVIRLEPGTTKNNEGREVVMTDAVFTLLAACVIGKTSDDKVFARKNGKPVRDFRNTWENACVRAGVGTVLCTRCSEPKTSGQRCPKCKAKHSKYSGLIFHDLRRTAARNLRRAGIAEGVIMSIGGWKTRSVFERYAIVNRTDIVDAMRKLEEKDRFLEQAAIELPNEVAQPVFRA